MAAIVINEKFRTLIPPLNKAEYTELEKSLKNLVTDHIDFYHFWGMNKDKFDNILMNWL